MRNDPSLEELPDITTGAEVEALSAEPARWEPQLARLATRLGLGGRPLRSLGGSNLVVAVGDDRVIKLAPPAFRREIDAEPAALGALGDRSWPGSLRTPRLLGQGIHGGWSWVLLERLPGATLASSRADLSATEREEVARELGRWIAELQRAPRPSAPAFAGSWSRYVADAAANAVARQARWGGPPEVCGEMRALLDRVSLACAAPTLLHADLHDDNVLVERRAERLVATGVIDFGDAMEGDPLFELVTPVALVARGDAALVRALFEGAGCAHVLDDRRAIDRFMAMSIAHRFNDLTRLTAWAPRALESLAAIERALLG